VVGVPDEEWGERIVAAVVPYEDATADPDEIRAFVRARLRGSRTPDDVVLRDSLPYTPTGKLLRREIVADLSSQAAVNVRKDLTTPRPVGRRSRPSRAGVPGSAATAPRRTPDV
jgi:acyl-CoA synthetase (AMP-forming)/AMP-acid ligase II